MMDSETIVRGQLITDFGLRCGHTVSLPCRVTDLRAIQGYSVEDLHMGSRSVVLCEHSVRDATYAIGYVNTALSDGIVKLGDRSDSCPP